MPTAHSCPESQPVFRLDLLKLLVDDPLDAHVLLVKVTKLAKSFHPRLVCVRSRRGQLLLNRFSHELAQRNALFSRFGLGFSEHRIGHFERRLHEFMVPYLWAHDKLIFATPPAPPPPSPPAPREMSCRRKANCGFSKKICSHRRSTRAWSKTSSHPPARPAPASRDRSRESAPDSQ